MTVAISDRAGGCRQVAMFNLPYVLFRHREAKQSLSVIARSKATVAICFGDLAVRSVRVRDRHDQKSRPCARSEDRH